MNAPRREILAEGVEVWLGDCREVLSFIPAADTLLTDPVWPNCPPGLLQGAEDPRGLFEQMWACCALPVRAVVVMRFDSDPRFLSGVPLPFVRAAILPYAVPGHIGRMLGGDEIAYCFGEVIPSRVGQRVIPGRAPMAQPNRQRERGHPCARVTEHFEFLVRWWSEEGETVLDPFMGSGTTGADAVKLGRRFVGIEVEESYFDIARRRIVEAMRQRDLFIGQPKHKTATQEALSL